MSALAPAFRSVDCIAGLNLNYRKAAVGFSMATKTYFFEDMDLGDLRGIP